ncbi:MAG: hypothetical protein AAF441_13490 [Pseudomonadota bacterium]
MNKAHSRSDFLKIAALTAAALIILALAFSALLPETFSRAQAASSHVSEFVPDEQVYSAKKKRKKRKSKKKGRGFFDSSYGGGEGGGGGGGGGSYHTNPDPDPEVLRQP